MIEFERIQKQVLNGEEAMQYLGLTSKSTLENLIRLGRLTPLKIAQSNLYALSELDDFIVRELATARALNGASGTKSEAEDDS